MFPDENRKKSDYGILSYPPRRIVFGDTIYEQGLTIFDFGSLLPEGERIRCDHCDLLRTLREKKRIGFSQRAQRRRNVRKGKMSGDLAQI